MRKRIIYVIIIVVLLLTGCTIGGSFYMLNFSLTPDAKILSKDADSIAAVEAAAAEEAAAAAAADTLATDSVAAETAE